MSNTLAPEAHSASNDPRRPSGPPPDAGAPQKRRYRLRTVVGVALLAATLGAATGGRHPDVDARAAAPETTARASTPTPSVPPTPTVTVTTTVTATVTETPPATAPSTTTAPATADLSGGGADDHNSTDRDRMPPPVATVRPLAPGRPRTTAPPAPDVYYANCAAARAAGVAPLHVGERGYRRALDRDGGGVACE